MSHRWKEAVAAVGLLAVSWLGVSHCQWVRAVGRGDQDLGWCLIQTSDRGYAMAGWTGTDDVFLVKFDSIADYQWSRIMETPTQDRAQALLQTADGGYALAGVTGNDMLLAKFDSSGNHLWSKTLDVSGFDQAYSLIPTADGGYAVAGLGADDFALIKLDSLWEHEWTRTLGGSSTDEARSLIQTTDGGYALAGNTWSYGAGNRDVMIMKLDSFGNHEWSRVFGRPDDDGGGYVAQTGDGGYVVGMAGYDYGAGGRDLVLTKFDSLGSHEWSRYLGGDGHEFSTEVIVTNGDYMTSGWTSSFGAGDYDLLLSRFDSTGDHLWTTTVGGEYADKGYDVVETVDGGYTVGGYTATFSVGNLDFLIVLFNGLGESCMGEFITPAIGVADVSVEIVVPPLDTVLPTIAPASLTISAPAPTVTNVCGGGSAVLICSLWAEPDTSLLGGDVYLYMSAENRGLATADSVVPEIAIVGGDKLRLVTGPAPSHVDLAPLDDAVYAWTYASEDSGSVYWTGYASGFDRWSDTVVTSQEAASNEVIIEIFEMFKRADADGDMDIQMSDAIYTLQYLYVPGAPEPTCMDAVDADDNGDVTMSDALFTLRYLYVPGSPAPSPPFPDCGTDPTADPIRCAHHRCPVEFIRGDCTGDSLVNLVDVFYIIQYVDFGEPVPDCLDAADANDDGVVDIDDANYLSDYLVGGGSQPPSPFPGCGLDPTEDALGCTDHPCMHSR